MIRSKKPKSEYMKQKAALWLQFSLYIRLRDTKGDWGRCLSCGKPVEFGTTNCQAGHFIQAGYYPAIEFDEQNVNVQCYHCNMKKQGNQLDYEQGMIKKYGQAVVDKLKMKKHNSVSRDTVLLRILTADYQAKAEELKRQYLPKFRQ